MKNKSTPLTDQDEFDKWKAEMSPERRDAWLSKLAGLARSTLTNADGSLKPETPEHQSSAPGLHLVPPTSPELQEQQAAADLMARLHSSHQSKKDSTA